MYVKTMSLPTAGWLQSSDSTVAVTLRSSGWQLRCVGGTAAAVGPGCLWVQLRNICCHAMGRFLEYAGAVCFRSSISACSWTSFDFKRELCLWH